MVTTSDIYGVVMARALLEVCQLHISALGIDVDMVSAPQATLTVDIELGGCIAGRI